MHTLTLNITAATEFALVKEFAESHGCTVELISDLGGSEITYKFSSDNIHFITELAEQILQDDDLVTSLITEE